MSTPIKRRKTRAEKIEDLLDAIVAAHNDPATIHTNRVEKRIIAAEKYLQKHPQAASTGKTTYYL